jgi:hypothetical protein
MQMTPNHPYTICQQLHHSCQEQYKVYKGLTFVVACPSLVFPPKNFVMTHGTFACEMLL